MKDRKKLASISLFFIGYLSMAQGGSMPPPPSAPDPPGLPIDNGVMVLFFVALAFGAYRMYKLSKKIA